MSRNSEFIDAVRAVIGLAPIPHAGCGRVHRQVEAKGEAHAGEEERGLWLVDELRARGCSLVLGGGVGDAEERILRFSSFFGVDWRAKQARIRASRGE